MLVACGFWHVLQYLKPMLNRILPRLWQLVPLRRQIIPNVTLLFRRQFIPVVNSPIDFLSLRRIKILLLVIAVDDPSLFLWSQIVESPLRRRVRRRRTVRIITWPRRHPRAIYVRGRRPIRVRIRRTARASGLALVWRSAWRLLLLSALLPLFLPLLLPWSL